MRPNDLLMLINYKSFLQNTLLITLKAADHLRK